jgi:hypothetical protein
MRGARGGGNIHAGINETGPGIFWGRARDGLLEALVRGWGVLALVMWRCVGWLSSYLYT